MGFYNIRCMEQTAARCERFLNPIDKIPYLSSYSGVVRVLAAQVQIIAGLAFAAIKAFMALLEGNTWRLYEAKEGLVFCLHGLMNYIRGAIALFPFIGNLILFAYDYRFGRMEYRHEVVPFNVYPIIRNFVLPEEELVN